MRQHMRMMWICAALVAVAVVGAAVAGWEVGLVALFALPCIVMMGAMGWMMLAMVEGIVRSEGGLGALMVNANKHLQFASVFALIGVVLAVGVAQDLALRWLRRVVCPAADLRR